MVNRGSNLRGFENLEGLARLNGLTGDPESPKKTFSFFFPLLGEVPKGIGAGI
jgi:hypothetical protein